jgi:outer membrane receptor protein involved in Fe transport
MENFTAGILGARVRTLASVSMIALMAAASPALAQSDTSARQSSAVAPEEIIVTARKREESIMKAPVVITAVPQKTIENLHLTSVESLSSVEPSLKINFGFSLSGITANLRGLGNGPAANYIDQSIALNLDGFTSNSGQLFRAGLFDMAQIEVMKGPQALFYGKSTSAGLIAIHSADPTSTWDTKVTVGYEFRADEMDLDGYVSGPITDMLGVRLAGYHNTSKGWLTNPNPNNPVHRVPGDTNDGGRLTLKYDNPDTGLRIKFKGSITKDTSNHWVGDLNQYRCPASGDPEFIHSLYDDCKVNNTTYGNPPPHAYNPSLDYSNPFNLTPFTQGSPIPMMRSQSYAETESSLAVLNVDYDVMPGLTVSSVTALDWLKATDAGGSSTIGTPVGLDIGGQTKSQEFSEELRLTSNWKDSWINFMIGGLYNPSTRKDQLGIVIPQVPLGPPLGTLALWTDDSSNMKSETDSVFGQINLTPIDKWELDAGVRYIHVNKHFISLIARGNYPSFFYFGTPGEGIQNLSPSHKAISENATVPEFTLSYKPTDDITAFVSYKHGYKGPGFDTSLNISAYNDVNVPKGPFGGERVKGVEGGIKAQLMDRQLAVTMDAYRYNYKGLQVSYSLNTSNTLVVANGADARVQGVEIGAVYSPQSVRGLSLKGFLNYNDTHYTSYPTAPCYAGEPVSEGCVYPVGLTPYQNLAGRTVHMAPKVTGNFGGSYTWDLNDKYGMAFDASADYSSSYLISPELSPLGRQAAYVLLNLSLRLDKSDGSWELAALCRNCTDNYYAVNGISGDNGDVTVGRNSTVLFNVARPRQFMLQLTVHPNLL